MLDPARLVFIDETAVSTNMVVRLRGRAPRGVTGDWRRSAWKDGRRSPSWPLCVTIKWSPLMVVEGAMTGEMFLVPMSKNCLDPTLRLNDIVVMDMNCRVHLGTGTVASTIETVGATLRYLPKPRRPTSIPSRDALQQIQDIPA